MDAQSIPNRRLYPIPEARALLGNISNSYFYNLVGQGFIRIVKIGTRSFLTSDEIENVVARLEEAERRETENGSAEGVA